MGVIHITRCLMRSCDPSIDAPEPDLSFGQKNCPLGVIKHLKSRKIIEMS